MSPTVTEPSDGDRRPLHPKPRRVPPYVFHLLRVDDESGVSGTGIVADGCVFENGKAVLSWRSTKTSVAVYDSLEMLMSIHGHDGKTKVVGG